MYAFCLSVKRKILSHLNRNTFTTFMKQHKAAKSYLPHQGLVRPPGSGLAGTRSLSSCSTPGCWSVWCGSAWNRTSGTVSIADSAQHITAPLFFSQLQERKQHVLEELTCTKAFHVHEKIQFQPCTWDTEKMPSLQRLLYLNELHQRVLYRSEYNSLHLLPQERRHDWKEEEINQCFKEMRESLMRKKENKLLQVEEVSWGSCNRIEMCAVMGREVLMWSDHLKLCGCVLALCEMSYYSTCTHMQSTLCW